MALSIVALLKILFAQLAGLLFLYQATKVSIRSIYIREIFGLITGIFVLMAVAPSVWVIYGGVMALMFAFGSKPDRSPGVFLLLFVMLPSFPLALQAGSIPLITLNVKMVLGLAAAAVAMFRRDRGPRFGFNFWALLLIFASFDIFSHARGTAISNVGRESLQTTLGLIIPVVAMASLVSRVRNVRIFSAYVLATGVALTMIIMLEAVSGWNIYRSIYLHVGLPPIWDQLRWRNGLLRATGPIFEATSMGFIMTLFLLFAWSTKGMARNSLWHLLIVGLVFLGVYLTQSRNPVIGAGIGLAAWYIFNKTKTSKGWMALACSIGLALAAITVIFNVEHASNPNAKEETTLQYRQRLFDRGLQEFRKSPILGDSQKGIEGRLYDLRQGEGIIDFVNTYLYVALIGGVFSLIIFIITLMRPSIYVVSLKNSNNYKDETGAFAFVYCMSIATIFMVFFTFFFAGISVIYLLLMAVLVRLRMSAAAQAKQAGQTA